MTGVYNPFETQSLLCYYCDHKVHTYTWKHIGTNSISGTAFHFMKTKKTRTGTRSKHKNITTVTTFLSGATLPTHINKNIPKNRKAGFVVPRIYFEVYILPLYTKMYGPFSVHIKISTIPIFPSSVLCYTSYAPQKKNTSRVGISKHRIQRIQKKTKYI